MATEFTTLGLTLDGRRSTLEPPREGDGAHGFSTILWLLGVLPRTLPDGGPRILGDGNRAAHVGVLLFSVQFTTVENEPGRRLQDSKDAISQRFLLVFRRHVNAARCALDLSG